LQKQIAPLQTAQVSHEVLLNLFCDENKPQEITPLDLAMVGYLISRKAFDHEIFDSQSTLALRLSADYKAVKRSLERLDELGWITYRGRGNGLPKAISLNIDKLPAAQPIRDKITPDASRLVDYYLVLKRSSVNNKTPTIQNGKLIEAKLKLPRNWSQRQLPSAQRLLTRYGDYEKAAQVVYALFHHEVPGIQSKARRSLHNLLNMLPKARRLQQRERSRMVLEEVAKATEAAFSLPITAIRTNEGRAA
jgi:hypothetical protein